MEKHTETPATHAQPKAAMPGTKPMPGKPGTAKPDKSAARPDPKATAQEAVHQVMGKDAARKAEAANPAVSKPHSPQHNAKGDGDQASKQQHQAMPSVDEVKGKWKQQMGSAKIAWGKLTEDELLKSEGHEQKLAGLVQERYAVSRDEAHKQVKGFFEKYRS